MERLIVCGVPACTLTKKEFVEIGANACAELMTGEAANTLPLHITRLLTELLAIYHTEMEKQMFPTTQTDK